MAAVCRSSSSNDQVFPTPVIHANMGTECCATRETLSHQSNCCMYKSAIISRPNSHTKSVRHTWGYSIKKSGGGGGNFFFVQGGGVNHPVQGIQTILVFVLGGKNYFLSRDLKKKMSGG